MTDVSTSLAERRPRVEVTVKRAEAAARGLTDAAVGQLVAQAYQGTSLGQVAVGGGAAEGACCAPGPCRRRRWSSCGPCRVPGGTLADVADVTQVDGPIAAHPHRRRPHRHRQRHADRLEPGRDHRGRSQSGSTARRAGRATFTVGGVSADQEEAFADLGLAVLAAIAIVFLIMVATFRSLLQPLILLVSIPFAATGAIALLLVTGTPLGVPALIGVLMLVGIVVTNAIVLIDLINQYRAQGMARAGGGCRGRPAPAAADPDDGDRDDLRAAPDGARAHR